MSFGNGVQRSRRSTRSKRSSNLNSGGATHGSKGQQLQNSNLNNGVVTQGSTGQQLQSSNHNNGGATQGSTGQQLQSSSLNNGSATQRSTGQQLTRSKGSSNPSNGGATHRSGGEQLRRQFENEKGAILSTRAQMKARSNKSFTAEEVAEHDAVDDCWITINDKVYDVTTWVKAHPGGPVIATQAGRDGTEHFLMFHSATAWGYLAEYYIGDLKKDADEKPKPDLLDEFRELRSTLEKAQLFKSSKTYYLYKSLLCLAILAASLAVISASKTFPAVIVSACLLGLFGQQCAWLFHDFLHHQVTEDRKLNSLIGGLFLGNLVQGYSGGWWTSKHNTHHAATNETDEEGHPVDPDIDTVPLLAFSKEVLASVDNEFSRSILKFQHIFFVPLLFLGTFRLKYLGWDHASHSDMTTSMRVLEMGSLLVHHAAFTATAFSMLPAGMAVSWLLLSQLICGFLISGIWVLSHNGMDVHNDARDFVTAQISSTRNIEGNIFNEWFTGGLNRQIEHHLFPTLPRHNLKLAAPYVKVLCKKHDIKYQEDTLSSAIGSVFGRVVEVAQAA